MTSRLPSPCLALVTSRKRLSPDARTTTQELGALEAFLDEAVDARVDLIQIREPDVPAGLLAASVARVLGHASAQGVLVLVNDRADVAAVTEADGVHLPAHGLPSRRVREAYPSWIIGRSVHDGDAMDDVADYLLFGTVFPSRSKLGQTSSGTEALARAASEGRVPVLAIGGVTPARVGACLDAGASGVAAIGAFLPAGTETDALGLRPAVAAFRAAFARMLE